ncbi:MAG: AEC family transporter [Oxalobacter sp.]|nr:MAG: AEC family transporter [Oxalobacter sp.]
MKIGKWPKDVASALSKFVFYVAVPALLFNTMSRFSSLPPVDVRLLFAFFGSCVIVFIVGRIVAWKFFKLDGVAQSVFALGGIYSNNVFLGIPLTKMTLGEQALPPVALIIAFNALLLWTLVTVSTEWALHGNLSVKGFAKTTKNVLTNPVVASILLGLAWDFTGITLPVFLKTPLEMTAQAAAPLALIVLGMGLAEYSIREGWQHSVAITTLKLAVQPVVVYVLARAIGLPKMETQAIVMLASISVAVNVYLMAEQFKTMKGAVASSMVLSTIVAAFTTPIAIALTG